MTGDLSTLEELARASGNDATVLESWQRQHGFPEPVRNVGGAVRYPAGTIAVVREVLERQRGRAEVAVAIDTAVRATAREHPPQQSIFAAVRDGFADVVPRTLTKRALLGVSWAVEDDRVLRSFQPLLVGAFQQSRFLAPSRERWQRLAAHSRATLVMTGGDDADEIAGALRVAFAPDDPLAQEWAVVCDSTDDPAVLAAWELPGQEGVPDLDRQFEAVWSLDAATTRRASKAALDVAILAGTPGAGALRADLEQRMVTARPDPLAADRFHHRVIAYVDRLGSAGRG